MRWDYAENRVLHDEHNNVITRGSQVHSSVMLGYFNVIGAAQIGVGVVIGSHCVIEDGVIIGDGTVLRNRVELRKGVVIGSDCYIDSGVTCTGNATIGNDVTLRNYVVVARGCKIGDRTFISPRTMFVNLDAEKKAIGGAHIGQDCFIGTHVVFDAGISVCDGAIIGSCALVTKDITEEGIYVGVPARKMK